MSIWLPERDDDGNLRRFVRPPRSALGDHFSAQRVIEHRKPPGVRRVVWLGESAAAGYLLAPHRTPAGRLEEILQLAAGGSALPGAADGFEVVDLARTNETLAGLVQTADAARQLEPDLYAVYVGNNWPLLETPEVSPYPPSVPGRQEVASALREGGPAGLAALARERLAERAGSALDRLAEIARSAGPGGRPVPVVLVLPEVNLTDWESRQPPLWLPGDGTRRWWRLHSEALEHLAAGDSSGAEAAAWEMARLDGSTGPTPFRLLARAWQLAGRAGDARDALLAEVDAVRYPLMASLDSPRATTDARRLLEAGAARHGWATVDLRSLFEPATSGGPPGRRQFLDYCHLTSEAIDRAMAGVASAIVGALSPMDPPDPHELGKRARRELPTLAPEAEATARLGAALHSAHRQLPTPGRRELLEHWCRAALEASPGIAETFVDLAATRTSPLPALLAAAQEQNLACPYRLELQHGWRWGGLDLPMLEAMAGVLRGVDREDLADEIDRLLLDGAALGPGESLELVAPRFRAEPLERFYPEVQDPDGRSDRATDRSPWPGSSFVFVTDGAAGGGLEIQVTARLPAVPGAPERHGETVRLLLDGAPLADGSLGSSWGRIRASVPAARLGRGAHRLTVQWPEIPETGDAALAGILRRLDEGLEADLHPIWGEVASVRVTRRG